MGVLQRSGSASVQGLKQRRGLFVDDADRHRLVEAAGRQHVSDRGQHAVTVGRDATAPSARRRLRGFRRSRGSARLLRSNRSPVSGPVASWAVGPGARSGIGADFLRAQIRSGFAALRSRSSSIPRIRLSCEKRSTIGGYVGRWTSLDIDVDPPRPVHRRPDSRISSQARRLAQSIPAGSTPRSKRYDDGLWQPQGPGGRANRQRREVGRLEQQIGRVRWDTSRILAPITPPKATGATGRQSRTCLVARAIGT